LRRGCGSDGLFLPFLGDRVLFFVFLVGYPLALDDAVEFEGVVVLSGPDELFEDAALGPGVGFPVPGFVDRLTE